MFINRRRVWSYMPVGWGWVGGGSVSCDDMPSVRSRIAYFNGITACSLSLTSWLRPLGFIQLYQPVWKTKLPSCQLKVKN